VKGLKKILFVCVENSCRSQMAEGLAKVIGKGVIEAYSAGSRPSGKVNETAVSVMGEEGIHISGYYSKGFSDLPVKKFDIAITLGCKDTCPFIPAANHVEWAIADPKGKDISFFKKTRDQIKEKITLLVERLDESAEH
jgi:arsenate reductase (thioredoxin)